MISRLLYYTIDAIMKWLMFKIKHKPLRLFIMDKHIRFQIKHEPMSLHEESRPLYPNKIKQTFKGDIIITDPCYFMKKEKENSEGKEVPPKPNMWDFLDRKGYKGIFSKVFRKAKDLKRYDESYREWQKKCEADDWDRSLYGDALDVLGFKTFLCRDTIFGDWSCSVRDTKTKKDIGSFCADSGKVCVCLLEEVLKYNPEFDYHKERKWTTALIENFDGEVSIVAKPYISWRGYKRWWPRIEREVFVVGKGNINFIAGMLQEQEEEDE